MSHYSTGDWRSSRRLLQILRLLGATWALLFTAFLLLVDVISPNNKALSDFQTSFYVAGYLVAHGQSSLLYPPWGAQSYIGAPFDRTTHWLFPQVPASLVGVFMYMPAVAMFFAPLSWLPPAAALFDYQCFNLVALVLCATCAGRLCTGQATNFLLLCCAFLPVAATLWVGQTAILFGLLPLLLGLYLLRRNKLIFAGFSWSLLFLKVQYLPVALLSALFLIPTRGWRPLIGVLIGVCLWAGVSVSGCGFETFSQWLGSFKFSESLVGGSAVKSPAYLIACLPGAILAQLPASWVLSAKLPVYAGAAIILLAVLFLAAKIIANRQFDCPVQEELLLSIAVLTLPLYVPRLMFYDLSLVVLPLWLMFRTGNKKLTALAVLVFGAIDLYLFLIVTKQGNPLALMAAYTGLVATIVCQVVRCRTGG